jgi:hypothetical protein
MVLPLTRPSETASPRRINSIPQWLMVESEPHPGIDPPTHGAADRRRPEPNSHGLAAV